MRAAEARACYELVEHTADHALEASAATLEHIFEALGLAVVDLITDQGTVEPRQERSLRVEAPSPELLLQRFLQATLCLFDSQAFVYSEAEVELGPGCASARLRGEVYEPARHGGDGEVKAVTHHELEIVAADGQLSAYVLLDI